MINIFNSLKKLKNQGGLSILVALVAILVASMVSVTIVPAAQSAMYRVYSDRDAEQKHLTLTSAAMVVKNQIKDTVLQSTKTQNKTELDYDDSGFMNERLRAAITKIDNGQALDSDECKGIKIEPEDSGTGIASVYMSYVIAAKGDDYEMTITFSMSETVGAGEAVFMKVKGKTTKEPVPVGDEDYEEGKSKTRTTINWYPQSITGSEAASGT